MTIRGRGEHAVTQLNAFRMKDGDEFNKRIDLFGRMTSAKQQPIEGHDLTRGPPKARDHALRASGLAAETAQETVVEQLDNGHALEF